MVIKVLEDIKIFRLRYEPIAENRFVIAINWDNNGESSSTVRYCSSGPCTVETRTHTQKPGLR
jgi:hypothetical protein